MKNPWMNAKELKESQCRIALTYQYEDREKNGGERI